MSDVRSLPYTQFRNPATVSAQFKTTAFQAPGTRLFAAYLANRNAAIRFFQVWSSPTIGQGTLLFEQPVPLSTVLNLGRDYFGLSGFPINMTGANVSASPAPGGGFSAGFSTTAGSWVAGTAADHDFYLQLSGAASTQSA